MKKKSRLFIDKLNELSDDELMRLCNEYIDIYNLYNGFSVSLKNSNIINTKDYILDNIDKYISIIIKHLNTEEIKALRYIIRMNKLRVSNIDYIYIRVLDLFKKFLLIDYSLDDKYYFITKNKDINKTIKKLVRKRSIIKDNKIFNKNNVLIRGIINYRGVISVNDMLNIVKQYTDIKDLASLKNIVLLDSKISNCYKVMTKNRKVLCINNYIESDSDIKALLKNTDNITYEEYMSYGLNNYKFCKAYKELKKLIKSKYSIKNMEMYYFNNYMLYTYCSIYKVNKNGANKYILDNVYRLFEQSKETIKNDLFNKIEAVALEYNLGGTNE